MDLSNAEQIVKYGQWVIVIISLLGVYLVSSTKPKSRLSGYIVTALGRFTGAMMFIILDLYAFTLIVNIIHTYIGLEGILKIKEINIKYLKWQSLEGSNPSFQVENLAS